MKKLFFTLFFLAVIFSAIAQNPTCDGNRYKNFAFGAIDSTINVQYGQNYTMNNVLDTLLMDIYQPKSDVATKRPLIIIIHGGGFTSGTKEFYSSLCRYFAYKGFVTATINYRLIDVPLVDSLTITEAMIKAMSDAKAAIRFFVEDAATNNTYKIDTNNIFLEGGSAGAMTASQVAYLDSSDNISTYIMNLIMANGGFKGNSSTNTSYSTPIKGVISYSGALWRKEWISPGEPALFCAHDDLDTIVPCNYGLSKAQPFAVYFYGSCAMQQEADLKGVYNIIYINNSSSGHMAYFGPPAIKDTLLQKTSNFLYDIICNNILSIKNDQRNIDSKIQLYPNPAKDRLTVQLSDFDFSKKIKLTIVNTQGQTIKQILIYDSLTNIKLDNIASGVYFYQLQNNDAILKTGKIIIV
jgi:para-nitrobenzyl esterase